PFYFSFDSSAGLLYRSYPIFNADNSALVDNFQTGQLMNRSSFAPRVTGAFQWAGMHLVPSFGIQETYYGEAQSPYLDRYHVVGITNTPCSHDFSLDLIFSSLARVLNKKTIFDDKHKHVIEPRPTFRWFASNQNDFAPFLRFDEND